MSQTNPKVDGFFRKPRQWQEEFKALREIARACALAEEIKWRWPCYTFQGKNIVLFHGFKHYCAILFFKGALLKDPRHVLIQQTENVQAGRQIRFTSAAAIRKMQSVLKAYIREAVAVEKAGIKLPKKDTSDFAIPEEFQIQLDEMPELKTAFHALTPGRQRGYLLYFSSAKQSKTREGRVEKCMQRIFEGRGLDD